MFFFFSVICISVPITSLIQPRNCLDLDDKLEHILFLFIFRFSFSRTTEHKSRTCRKTTLKIRKCKQIISQLHKYYTIYTKTCRNTEHLCVYTFIFKISKFRIAGTRTRFTFNYDFLSQLYIEYKQSTYTKNSTKCERKDAHVLADSKNCRKKNLTVSSCQPSAAERRNVLKETVKIIEKPKRILSEKLCVRYLGKEHTTYMYIERERARVEEWQRKTA